MKGWVEGGEKKLTCLMNGFRWTSVIFSLHVHDLRLAAQIVQETTLLDMA